MPLNPLEVYRTALERVPAYRELLCKLCGDIPDVRTLEDFAQLPCMDKPGYILSYPLAARCLDGTLHGKHVIMHSSGTSGKYTYWPCSPEVEKNYWKTVYEELDGSYQIGTRSTLLILGVLMGGNMSGALFAYALRALGIEMGGRTTLLTPGRDEETCLDELAEFSPHYDQTIMYSYPSTAKNVLETAALKGIPIDKFHIRLRLLGEGYSEAWRDNINKLLGYPYGCLSSVNSGYGATDFRNAGRESLLCVAIKRLLHEKKMTREVLGLDDVSTICQYDPATIYLEELDGELVMTRHNAVPLVRYRSGDCGQLKSYEEMMSLLSQHGLDPLALMQERGCDPARATQRPFVMVTGRRDGGVTFHGAKIMVPKVKAVLEETPYLSERLTGEFQIKRGEDADLQPFLELRLVPRPEVTDLNAQEVSRVFAEAYSVRQGGIYADVLAKNPSAAQPRIRFVRREEIMTGASFKIRYLG